jgi:hypothetical protein
VQVAQHEEFNGIERKEAVEMLMGVCLSLSSNATQKCWGNVEEILIDGSRETLEMRDNRRSLHREGTMFEPVAHDPRLWRTS